MTELPRYRMTIDEIGSPSDDGYGPVEVLEPDGPWVKWADVSLRLQQLETERDDAVKEAEEHYGNWKRLVLRVEERKIRVEQLEQEKARLQEDSDVLRRCNIIEIAVRNETGSVSEYMNHWEGRALKAEAALAETRDALHQLQEKYDQVTRVEPAG